MFCLNIDLIITIYYTTKIQFPINKFALITKKIHTI